MLGLCQFYINLINAKFEFIFCSVVVSWIWLDSFPKSFREAREEMVSNLTLFQ